MRIWIACVVAINLLAAGCGSTPDPATDDEIDRAPKTETSVKPALKPEVNQAPKEVQKQQEAREPREIQARMLLNLAQRQELRDKKWSIKSYQRLLDDFGDTREVKRIVIDIKKKIVELKQ